MITNERTINKVLPVKVTPIQVAAACYKKWNSNVEFIDDLDHYLLEGMVVSRPDVFLMAKIIDIAPEGAPKPEPAWFVRMAVGELAIVAAALPRYCEKVLFCRRNDGRMRVYSLDRLMHWALFQHSKKEKRRVPETVPVN